MVDPSLLDEVRSRLSPPDFYREAHERLFELMLVMATEGAPIDMVAVCDRIQRTDDADRYGGLGYVSGHPDDVVSTENIAYYTSIVLDMATARRVISTCRDVAERGLSGELSGIGLGELAIQQVEAVISRQGPSQGWMDAETVASAVYQDAVVRMDGSVPRLYLPWSSLARLCSFEPGHLVVCAGRPGMGKSAMAGQLALNVARRSGAVALFSLEMSAVEYMRRLVMSSTDVSASRVRAGTITRSDLGDVLEACSRQSDLPLYMMETPGIDVEAIVSRSMALYRRRPDLRMVVVDHVGLVRPSNPKWSSYEARGHVSRTLKGLAKTLGVVVLELVQLSRKCEERLNKQPLLSDLRDSGNLEEDADAVLLLYRDEYYRNDSPERGLCRVRVAKQRDGPVGQVVLGWDGGRTSFSEVERGRWPQDLTRT